MSRQARNGSAPTQAQPQPAGEVRDVWKDGVSTGSFALDLALGTGGWPRGRIVEIFGPTSSGKTSLLLEAIAHAQAKGGFGAFIDADHGLEPRQAERLGVQVDAMPFHRPANLEDAFARVEELVTSGALDVIALDGIGALLRKDAQNWDDVPPRQDQEHQHKIDVYLRLLLGPLSRSRTVLLITNHVVEKVGVTFGTPEMTPWVTHPVQNYASQRVRIERIGQIKEGDRPRGAELKAKVVKNRLGPAFTSAEMSLYFATGFSYEADLIALGLETGVVAKRGNWLHFGDVSLGNGSLVAARHLEQDADLAGRLRAAILERLPT